MKEISEESGCVEWLGCLWHVNCWDVRVYLVRCMVVFSQAYFDGDWFLLHIQRGSDNGSSCRMGCATLGDSGEWLWIWPHSCECGHICALVRVGVTTWFSGDGKYVSGACAPHAQGSHLLRRQRMWSVSFERGTEGGIFPTFPSVEFPAHCQVGGRCIFWHLCPSL